MQKKGDFDITVFQWTFSIILAIAVVAALLVFIENSASGVSFKKNVLARDAAILVNALYMAPADAAVDYPINEMQYKFKIGRLPEGFRVKVNAEGDDEIFATSYRYAEDSNFANIDFKSSEDYASNGLLMIKTNKGVSIFDISPDSSMPKAKGKKIASSIPIVRHFVKEDAENPEKLAEDAKNIGNSMKAIWPVRLDESVVTSCYGDRKSTPRKSTECSRDHCGIDIRAVGKDGKPASIVAMDNGVVKSIENKYGVVAIQHGKVLARYVHLSNIYVGINNIVKKGDIIGIAGTKGLEATTENAVHLHFSTLVDGVYFDPFEIGIFDANEAGFKKGSNCFENEYGYSSIIKEKAAS